MDELVKAVTAMDADPGMGAIVVTGSAKAFAAGADIKEMESKGYMDMYAADWFRGWEDFTGSASPWSQPSPASPWAAAVSWR